MKNAFKRFTSFMLALIMVVSMLPLSALAVEFLNTTVLDGKIKVYTDGISGQGSAATNSDGSITVNTWATEKCEGIGKYSYTANAHKIWIENTTTETLMVACDYTATALASMTVDGANVTVTEGNANGVISKSLEAGGKIEVIINSKADSSSKEASPSKITFSNFELKDTSTKSVTVVKQTGGTTTVNGTSLSANSTTVDTDYATGVTVTAKADKGYVFLGWVDENMNVLSTVSSYRVQPLSDMTVAAVFVANDTQGYWLGGGKLHTDLAAACTAAQAGDKQVVLLKSATLASGNYEIPADVTLLIPKDEVLTSYGDDPALANNGAKFNVPTNYRTLTLASGANLVVNGTMELAAMHHVSSGSSSVTYGGAIAGAYARIDMKANSNIRVNGTMYAWGMVTGSGTVDVYGTVYEKMQVNDYRGGTATSALATTYAGKKLFPFSQYYVQNVEVPETIHSGGKLMVHCGVYLSAPEATNVEFVGSNGMFKLSSGSYVTKEYIASTDRLKIDLYGNAALSSIALSFEGQSVDSFSFRLGINNNIDIHVHSGVTAVAQQMVLQSGATVTVDKDATLYNTTEIFVMDAEDWGTYCRAKTLMPVKWSYSNGTTVKRTSVTDAIVDINGTAISAGQVYSTGSDSIISSEGTGVYALLNPANSSATLYQLNHNSFTLGYTSDWVQIACTPAILVNGDGSDPVKAEGAQYDAYIYDTFQDKWIQKNIYNGGAGYAAKLIYNADNGAETPATYEASVDYFGKAAAFMGNGNTAMEHFYTTVVGNDVTKFIREGYKFVGWSTEPASVAAAAAETNEAEPAEAAEPVAAAERPMVEVGKIITISGDTTLYAVWEGQPFNLHWNGEVNEIAAGTDLSKILGDVNLFQFYTDANYTTEYTLTDGKMPIFDLYVKAKVLNAVTVDDVVKTENYAEGADLNTLLAAFYNGKTVENFNFYSDAECTKPVTIVDGKMPAHALYAKSLYSVTVVDTKDEAELAKWNLEAGTKLAEKLESLTVTAPENKKFIGWFLNGEKIDETTVMPARNTEIQALYAELFTVTFKVNGSVYGDPFYADVNNQYKINIGNPEGENFGGWQDSDGKLYQKDETITLTENLVLNAHFHADTDPKDHKCDGCDKTGMGTHADGTDNDHVCDYCQGDVGETCVDADKNHYCDECGTILSCKDYVVHREGVEPRCHVAGLKENWHCEICDVYYLDAECEVITSAKDLPIPALETTADHAPAKAATCTAGGNLEYWFCNECDQVWADEALTKLSSIEEMQIGALGHSFKTVDAQTATCVAEGNLEHKQCETCKLYFAVDAATDSTAGQAENTAFITPKDSSNHTNNLKYTNNLDGTHSAAYECCNTPGVQNEKHNYSGGSRVCVKCGQEQIRISAYAPGWDMDWEGNGLEIYKNGQLVDILTLTGRDTADEYMADYYETDTYEIRWHKGNDHEFHEGSYVIATVGDSESNSTITWFRYGGDKEMSALADGQRLYPECSGHNYNQYVDNGNGTHTLKCGECNAIQKTENHDYDETAHKCECGAVETFPMHFYLNEGDETPVATLQVPFGTALQTASYQATDELKALAEEASKSLTTTPTKDHYTYKGWLIDGVATTTMPAEDVTIYASWIAVEYTITYDLNGGQFKASVWRYDESAIYGEWFYLNAINEPDVFPVEREGYTFTHFLDQEGAKYEPECNGFTGETRHWLVGAMPGYNLTLTAQWKINQYTITFENTGDKEYAPLTMDYGEDIDPIDNPEKAGYKFVGWTDENGNSVSIPATMPGKNMTLTAQWEINRYTLTFLDENGNTIGNPVSYEVGAEVTATYPSYSKQNYDISWDAKIPATMPANDVVIKAVATPKSYIIVFGGPLYSADVNNNWTVTVPEDPTQAGYTFAGWATTPNATTADTSYKAGDTIAFTENKTFYPVFTANNFTVTLNGNGGLFGNEETWSVTGACGTAIDYANVQPVREGYDFYGWKLNNEGETVNLPTKIPTADAEYFAQWTLKQVTVNFDEGETNSLTGDYFSTVTAPTLEDTESHTFLGWAATDSADAEILYQGGDTITLNKDVAGKTFIAKWEAKKFDVIYYVDGTEVHRDTYAYGAAITQWQGYVPGEGYTFNGWSEIPATMGAQNVAVNGTTTVKTYTITWIVDGVETTTTVNHGDMPVYNEGNDPTKASTAQYTYTFSGWTPEIVAAKSAAEYTAQFTSKLRSYEITFVVDGVETKVSTDYGEKPVFSGTPEKESDKQYRYEFAGWQDAEGKVSETLPEITGEATFTATWTETPVEYTVTFQIGNDVHFTAKGGFGTDIDYTGFVEAPTKTGHTFGGWSMTELPKTFPAEDLVITGSFTPNKYTIHFYGNISTGAEYDDAFEGFSITKDYDAPITEEDLAELNLPEITGWEFVSWQTATVVQDEESEEITLEDAVDWDIPEKMPLNGLDLYARWEQEQYELEVKSSIDGELIIGIFMVYGESYETLADFNAINSFCYDSDCAEGDNLLPKGYTFEGYTYEDGSAVQFPYSHPADSVTIIAQFKPIDYTITFNTNGGEPASIESITAPYGTKITLPEEPTKTGYDFAGWVDAEENSVDLSTMPLNGAQVYAKWTEGNAIFSFFAYKGADTAYATFEVKTGSDLLTETPETDEGESKPSVLNALLAKVAEKVETEGAPVKTGHTFKAWDTAEVPETMPAEGVKVYGTWDVNSYDVTWIIDGMTYQTDSVAYGSAITKPVPTKEGHTFNGWTTEIPATMPAEPVTIHGSWTVNTYYITFDVEGIDTITASYGMEIEWPANPSKTGYTFQGWSTDGETVIQDLPDTMPVNGLNLKAVWQTNTVVITWIIDGEETIETYGYGKSLTVPEATKATDAMWSYKFTGWSPALPANGTATVNETYTAQFAEDAKVTYAVKFVDPADDTYSYSTRMAWDAQVNLEALEGFTAPTQTGMTLAWTVEGETVSFPYPMTTKEVTFVAKWTPLTYTIKFYHNASDTEPTHTISAEYGASVSYEYIAPVGYEFKGWVNKANNAPYTLPETMPAENLELVAVIKAKSYDVIFLEDGNETIHRSVAYSQLIPVETPTTTKGEGYTFQGWFDADGKKLDWNNYTMPAHEVTFTAKWTYTGWKTDENGTTYLVNDEKAYFDEIATIGNSQYGFDAKGYIVKDITAFNDKYHAFDHDTGVFLSNLSGIYTASNGDVYYVENGIAAANKGLVRIVGENGHIHYYYFGCSINSNCPSGYQCDPYKAQRNCVHWVENNNGMLVKWDYTFDENGVIEHQDDTSLNGIQTIGGKKFYLIDGVKVHKGLFKDGEYYYYARSSGELVVGRDYWITNLNGLNVGDKRIHEGTYTFDAEGRMILAEVFTGICEEDGKLFYYLDGATNYAGLIRYSGDLVMADGTVKRGFYQNDYLYVRTSGELAQGRYWITKNNGLMESKNYEFDSYGRMDMTDGLITVDGVLYYYQDGTLFYAGLIEDNGDYYYVKTSGQVVTGCSYWITKTNGLMAEKSYTFDESGKMLNPELIDNSKDGLVEENGSLYYYRNGAPYYAGLIEINGDYYYVKTGGEVVHGQKYWITKTNGLMKSRSYTFDENGVMLDPAPLA